MRRKVAIGAAVAGICIGVVVTRAVWDGYAALAEAQAAVDRGDLADAVAWYRRAARWYVPGAPHVARAYDRLEAIAREAERNGDIDTALAAWRGIRSSILATRSVYTPFAERLDPANRRIAALMAEVEGPSADPGASAAEREAWHYDLLRRDDAPSVAWSLVALAGFAMWVGGGLWFALRAVTPDDKWVGRVAARSGIAIAAGLVLWLVGLYRA